MSDSNKRRRNPLRTKRRHIADKIDYDYLDKLSAEEREFLEKFTDEYYHATASKEEPLHTPEQMREIYRENNARFRDTTARFSRMPEMNMDEIDPVICKHIKHPR